VDDPSPTTASTSGCRLAFAWALSRGSAVMSAKGSGVRLTATTVPGDQARPSDGPALLHKHSDQVRRGRRTPMWCSLLQ